MVVAVRNAALLAGLSQPACPSIRTAEAAPGEKWVAAPILDRRLAKSVSY
jgi:hypothetical protein